MSEFKDLFQSADWKKEKHIPVIEAYGKVKTDEYIKVTVNVGKEIPHPNTTEHHISWIDIYFFSEDQKFPIQLGKFGFSAHGASVQGADTSTIYTHPEVTLSFKTQKTGIIYASSYCNIHGLWQNALKID